MPTSTTPPQQPAAIPAAVTPTTPAATINQQPPPPSPVNVTPEAIAPVTNEAKPQDQKIAAPVVKPEAPVDQKQPVQKGGIELGRKGKTDINKKHVHENNKGSQIEAPLTPDQIIFISNEMIVFGLPEDDIALGELTEDGHLRQMSGSQYLKEYEQSFDDEMQLGRRADIEMFKTSLDFHEPGTYTDSMQIDEASAQAFDAVSRSNLSDLRTLIDNYPILQMRDERGDTMLHVATDDDQAHVARLLLIRGIDLRAMNHEGENAASLARDPEMSDLLDSAMLLRR